MRASKTAFPSGLAALGLMLLAVTVHAQQDLEPAVQTSPAPPAPGPAVAPAPKARPGPAAVPVPVPAGKPASPVTGATTGATTSPTTGAVAAPAKGAKSSDSIQLETTQISGNRELPRVMYVVPWRRPDPGEFSGRPPNSLLDEALTPVDRDVFRRQNRYYSALSGEPGSHDSQPGAAGTAVASPTPKDEK
jgi:hypothetical protein